MKKLNLHLWVYALLFFAIGCVKDDDAEYDAAMKAQQEETQPQLVPSNEPSSSETQTINPSVTTPAAPETREVTPKEAVIKPQVVEKKEVPVKTDAPFTEKPLYNSTAKKAPATTASAPLNAPEMKPKSTPQEITMRGAPSATQSIERGVSNPEPVRSGTTAAFSIDKMTYDFGEKTEGEKVAHTFILTNTGNTELYIQDVVPSCNCTVPDFDFDAIKPGKSTELKVVFDTNGKVGTQRKTVRVITNGGERTLTLVGTVFPKNKNY